MAGSGAPTQGGVPCAGGADGTAGKLRVVLVAAVTLTGTVLPLPVKPVYSVPLAGPAVTLSVPPVVVAGTVNQ